MLLRAIEEKTFLPVGSDREVKSDFQLICGTNRDLAAAVAAGRFREDLLARIDLWTFRLPGLAERTEDIAPNLEFELESAAQITGGRVAFNAEARARFLRFAVSPEAIWSGNFRDFSAAVTRMATLASGGRITAAGVDEEIVRLRAAWQRPELATSIARDPVLEILGEARADALDRFDRAQLAEVIRVCQKARSLSEAGRLLFAASRSKKSSVNDADRLRKYLARFELGWSDFASRA